MEEKISAWKAFVLLINNIVGAGVLSIPWAYTQGGILTGLLSQVIVSILSIILSYQFLQTMSRVSTIKSLMEKGYKIKPVPISKLFVKTSPKDFIENDEDFSPMIKDSDLKISESKSDMTGMILLVLGKNHAIANCLLFTIGSLVILISYSSIFGSSLASSIPILGLSTCNIYEDTSSFGDSCWRKYWFYILILLFVASFLVMIKLKEQAWFQGILAIMRFLVGLLIIVTCLVALIQDKNLDDNNKNHGKAVFFDISGAGLAFSIIILASYYHPFIPNAIQWMEDKESDSALVLNLANLSVSILYAILGVIVSLTIYDVQEMVTLEWEDYTGGHSEQSWWSYIILYIIILFPALDIASVFPLVSINVSDNVMSLFDISESEENKYDWNFILIRLAFVIIPIICSVFFYNIGMINNLAGLLTIVNIGFYMPAMSIASQKIVPQNGTFDKWFSGYSYSILVFIAYFLVLVISVVLMILYF